MESSTSSDQNELTASGTPTSSVSSPYRRTYSDISGLSHRFDVQSFYNRPSNTNVLSGHEEDLSEDAVEPKDSVDGGDGEDHDQDSDIDSAEDAELEMMRERFAKLLLGEDMSGSGKGVCTAVTVSNAITNLYATVFGQSLRLQPLSTEKKDLWKREMNCFMSICDYIVEVIPRSLGNNVEITETKLRSDILMNLPALRKLDNMLMEILDSFTENEFWYVERGSSSMHSNNDGRDSGSFRKVVVQRKDEKWWLPVPCVPAEGLSEDERKNLRHKRDCANQIHKAALAINDSTLNDMDIPDSYLTTLPKSGKASVGDVIYKQLCTAEKFYPDQLLDILKISSEHEALELADKVEASLVTWRRKTGGLTHSRSSWDMMKDMGGEAGNDKNHILAARARSLLFCLKQRYPELSQTSLDICKIQYNRDVGKAVLESYSRVLEGLAYNVVSWIDDVLYVDRTVRNRDD
ncbi:Rop guanine nucleotide exchange factor 4 [Raphanus sativus]|uniref:Rop guanine nucleotide exchange factor 4 n=1 Tax=Raphanus sativus TaxID=3726 RepID=A0A6J0JLS5_RAPSA|nr:rop guanine nucleotide exchange factor 4 [Raphanus sativus]KAJ4892400.1 Rop guanine nucleotide exchange factor 4 [Raphanus sativus]